MATPLGWALLVALLAFGCVASPPRVAVDDEIARCYVVDNTLVGWVALGTMHTIACVAKSPPTGGAPRE